MAHRARCRRRPRRRCPIVEHHDGPATVAAYSVAHGRDGGPEWGLLVVDVPGGRAYARVEDADDLAALEAEEWVGRTVTLAADGAVNRAAAPDLTPCIRRRSGTSVR